MRQAKVIVILYVVVAGLFGPAYAQTTSNTNSTPNEPTISDTVKEFDKLEASSAQVHRSTNPSAKPPKSVMPVLTAIPQFRKATADLRVAVGEQKSMRGPLESLEKLIKPFAEYFKDLKLKPPAPDIEELKTYLPKDLVWETLTTAERIDNNLQIAGKLLRESNRSGAVTIQTLQFYGGIDSDLKRLKWLADRVEAQRESK